MRALCPLFDDFSAGQAGLATGKPFSVTPSFPRHQGQI